MTDQALNSIGIFDSGVGGTSIWKEIHELMPYEETIYLADSKNAPYGLKTKDEIISLCEKNTDLLLSKNCKIIVVACNTATTNAIKHLRSKYKLPFIGIEPAIKPASLNSKSKVIGILATKGTLSSELFYQTSSLFNKEISILEQEGAGIVELIESGELNSSAMKNLLQTYLDPMIKSNIDYLVLGCSHYPYLIPILEKILPPEVKIIDSGRAVAKQTKFILEQSGLLTPSREKANPVFFTNGDLKVLKSLIGNQYQTVEMDF